MFGPAQRLRLIGLTIVSAVCHTGIATIALAQGYSQPDGGFVPQAGYTLYKLSNLAAANGNFVQPVQCTVNGPGCPVCPPGCPTDGSGVPGYMGGNYPGGNMGSTGGATSPDGTPGGMNAGMGQGAMGQGGMGQAGMTPSQPNAPTFSDPGSGSLGNPNYIAASGSAGGYLDIAAPVTQFRLRYDDALNANYPDRGEYFYAQCGCFKLLGDNSAKGPNGTNIASVNYQAVRSYGEYAFNPKFSVFAEVPVQWDDYNTVGPGIGGPSSPGTSGGLANINAGFKYALIAEPTRYLTFQLRTYFPTGDSYQGLGNGIYSIEPGLLYYNRVSDRWIIQGQFTEWAPIDATGYASNVLSYGAGLGYILYRNGRVTVTPTFETVGWTFIGGREFNIFNNPPAGGGISANGDTIINVKPGVRIGWGDLNAPSGQQRNSLYFGWGHAVTSDQLYADIYRIEYRIIF